METLDTQSCEIEVKNHDIPIDDVADPQISQFATSIREKIQNLPPLSSDYCIYRVPHEVRKLKKKAYTPQIVSIGPLHHGKPELLAMEEYKLRYMEAFLKRSQMRLEDCIKVMKEWEERARNCYAERIEQLKSDQFVTMLIVDSCFVIEVMFRNSAFLKKKEGDYLTRLPIMLDIKTDMILLENQLPFFVLEELYNLAFPSHPNNQVPLFSRLSIGYFDDLMLINGSHQMISFLASRQTNSEVKHFVDLLRICHLPSPQRKSADEMDFVVIGTATLLKEAGMNFRGSSNCTLNLKSIHDVGVLEIPRLSIQDTTEILLRNLIALELCHYPFDSYIIDYIYFMDSLIDTAKDVDILIANKIIENLLGDSSEVATLFCALGKGTTLTSSYYYGEISENLNSYCKIRRHKWKATLKRDYFKTPWMIASTAAAVILLLLTFIQTICSIISL